MTSPEQASSAPTRGAKTAARPHRPCADGTQLHQRGIRAFTEEMQARGSPGTRRKPSGAISSSWRTTSARGRRAHDRNGQLKAFLRWMKHERGSPAATGRWPAEKRSRASSVVPKAGPAGRTLPADHLQAGERPAGVPPRAYEMGREQAWQGEDQPNGPKG